jgi:hypothetical protein
MPFLDLVPVTDVAIVEKRWAVGALESKTV